MRLRAHLNTSDAPPLVGQQSFQSFIQVSEKFGQYAIDDLGLASHNSRYKVYAIRVMATKREELDAALSNYKSMEGAVYWLKNAFPTNKDLAFFYSPYQDRDGWKMDYGLALGHDLYVVGRFELNQAVLNVIPDSAMLKDFKFWFNKHDFRTHSLLDRVRQDMRYIDLGPCSRTDSQVLDDEVVVSVRDLGVWTKKNGKRTWAEGEPEKYMDAYKQWVKQRPWWGMVELVLRPGGAGWADFVVKVIK